MKKIKLLVTIGLTVLELGVLSVFGIKVQAAVPDSYEYVAKLDISARGWRTYATGSCRDMVGSTNGELPSNSMVYVLSEALNTKGNLISYVYSPDLGKTCYISTKYLKKISNEAVEESVEDERAAIVDATNHEAVSKMVEGIYMIRPKVNEEACIDVKDFNNQSGANAQIWTNTGASNQLFRITKSSEDGYWKIQSLFSGKFLSAKKLVEQYSVANAVFMDESDSANQDFKIIYDEKDKYFNIINRETGYSLYVALGKTSDGTNVCLIPQRDDAAQDFVFCNVYVNNDNAFEKQRHNNTCTLASAANMIRKKLEIRGRDYSTLTEEGLRKIAWSVNGGLYNSFAYEDLFVTHCNISKLTDDEKTTYLKKVLAEHPEGVVVYSKYNLPTGSRPHACLLVDHDNGTFFVYDPSSATPDTLIDLEECTLKTKTTKMGAIDILWYIKN